MSQVKNNASPNLWDAITKEAGRVVNEAGRHITESIAEVQKGVAEGGFIGGALAAADKLSAGSFVAGVIDSVIPGADLPKPLAEGIAAGVNILSGNPIGLYDAFQAFSAAGGDGGKSAPANAPGGQRTQTPESPSSAAQHPPASSPQPPTHIGITPTPHAGGAIILRGSENSVVFQLQPGDNNVDIRKTAEGNVRVTINGVPMTLSPADAAKLVILGGSGDDKVTIGPGVTGVMVQGGGGADRVVSEGDRTMVSGGAGDDTVRVYADGAHVYGGAGNDDVEVRGNNAVVQGGKGNDRLSLVGNKGMVSGGDGNDRLRVRGNDARVHGGAGSDTINVRGNNPIVRGGKGDDVISVDARSPRWTLGPRPPRDNACDHNEFIGRARDIAERGGGFSAVEGALGGLEDMYGEIGELLGKGKANDATKKKIAKMEKESNAAIAELDKILNNPNLSFEDMIFMLMGALMKQAQTEVKGMTAQVREDKIAADKTKRELAANFDLKEAAVLDLEAKVRKDPNNQDLAKQLGDAKSAMRKAGDDRSDQIGTANDSRQEQLEAIKNAMNKITEMQQTLSNILNSMHQTAMSTIGNIR